MAQRHATRRYPDSIAFLREWREQLSMDALFFAPGALDDTPAPEMKLDLVLPAGQRIGPIAAQLINLFADGGAAFRLLDLPKTVEQAADQIIAEKDRWHAYLVETGELAPAAQTDNEAATALATITALNARVAKLEGELARAKAAAQRGAGPAAAVETTTTRGFIVPEVGHVAATLSGSLGDRSLRDAFMVLSVEKPTGLLTFELPGGRTRWAFVQKGGPVGFRCEPMDEQEVMGVLLFRAGTITKEQLSESLSKMEERGIRQGEALIEMGVFTFAQLVLVLQKQCEFVLTRVLAETAGTWTFHPLDELPERFVAPPMRVAAHLFRELRVRAKGLPQDELTAFLRPRYEQYVYVRPGVERTLDEMRLSADEQGFIKIIVGTSFRVRELPSVSNLSRGQTAAMLWCLSELNLLDYRSDASSARSEERTASFLASRIATVERGTLFDQIEVHWMCTTEDVEKAWRKFNVEFPPDQPQKYGAKNEAAVKRIIEAGSKAYDVLSSDTQRREYRATRIERVMIEQSALMLAGKGDMAVMKESMVEAWECFSKAAELMPNIGQYRAGMERAKAGRR